MKKILALTILIIVVATVGIIIIKKKPSPITSQATADMLRPEDIPEEDWRRALEIYQDLIDQNVDINFYGKVIDQDGQPVGNATVVVEIAAYVESLKQQFHSGDPVLKYTKHLLKSDAKGKVALSCNKGYKLYIREVLKEGYICPAENRASLRYAMQYRQVEKLPTLARPRILTLRRKTSGQADLKPQSITLHIESDGTENPIDLLRPEEEVETVDLKVIMWAGETSEGGQRHDWSFTVKCDSGGIVATDYGDGLYEAPIDGYKPEITWMMKSGSPDYSTGMEQKVYVKSRDGAVYAGIKMHIHHDLDGGGFFVFGYVVNTNGSRILEHEERL